MGKKKVRGWIYEDEVAKGMRYGLEMIEEKSLNRVVTEMAITRRINIRVMTRTRKEVGNETMTGRGLDEMG